MNRFPSTPPARRRKNAFTFVEMLVAMSMVALFVGTAALVMGAISANSREYASIAEVNIGSSAMMNFYEMSGSEIKAPSAPNFGRIGFVDEIRDKMLDDMKLSDSVYCLARSGLNSIRPEWIDWPYFDDPEAAPALDTPEAFRQFLAEVEPTSAGVFDAYRNVPSSGAPNVSIFMLGPTDEEDFIRVQAVYDIDYVTTSSPAGIYCSVRRYKNGARTHYYDIFFEEGPNTAFFPTVVTFERRALLSVDEDKEVDRFKVSHTTPFSFLWLPDPSINPLKAEEFEFPDKDDEPQQVYGHMANQSGYFMILPMFPAF